MVAHIEPLAHPAQIGKDGLQPVDELRAEHQGLHIGQIQTVANLVGGIAEVHGDGQTARLQDAEIHRQPLQAVHQQDAHFGAPLQSPAEQQVGKAVGLLVKLAPGDLPAVGLVRAVALDEAELPPGGGLVPLLRGVDLHQGRLVPVQPGVALQKVCDNHDS